MAKSKGIGRSKTSAVSWKDLPHQRLSSEIAATVAFRRPEEAHYELQLKELASSLPELDEEDHCEYTRLISGEINRELRICRDVYRKYLETLNKNSRTAKWGVALDSAVAPRAGRILRREICQYLHKAKVEPGIAEIFLAHNMDAMIMVPLGDGMAQAHIPKAPSIENLINAVVPLDAFQNLKKRFKKESFMVGGRFAQPRTLRCAMSYRVGFTKISMLYDANDIWMSQAGRMWDNVLHEIVAQQFQIDLDEQSDAMAAVEVLSPFDRIAGPLYEEAIERYTTIPDDVWASIGAKIDRAGISLKEMLGPQGKNALRDLEQQKICVGTWEEALLCQSDFGILEPKVIVGGKVKYKGMLSRHAKKAVYRARDKYRKVLKRVYENRVHL